MKKQKKQVRKVNKNQTKAISKKKKSIINQEKYEKRIGRMVIVFALSTVLMVVSTYAWFIGMKTVRVSDFEVKIAAIDGLSLSLTGEEDSWSDSITINKENHKTASYEGNTNSWAGKGLIPVSSIGKINKETSRLVMYEKGSFTATPGGYRVMASEVVNSSVYEVDGYVAFDLFIRNLSGNAYYEEVNVLNEEAIYLTPESKVTAVSTGINDENTGIENSVRVAFAQIGRVRSDADAYTITDITCETDDKVLGICETRNAQIWEPNDMRHVQNAINWYNESCKKRINSDLTKSESYSGNCGALEDGKFVPTYVVGGEIGANDQVDTYDGLELNGYTASISATPRDGKLYKFPTFTDTMKNLEETERPEFMTLAPNSITKVRIYVYLEGQDIDNYEYASLAKKVSVSFGFTKERFYGEDVEYNEVPPYGPELDDEVKERPRDDSGASIISSLCTNEDDCAANNLIVDPYGDVRYVGSNPNNYISFNGETWRIVGVFKVASKLGGKLVPRIKIVRDAFATPMSWDSSDESVNNANGINQWGESVYENNEPYEGADIMRLLNTYYIGKTNTCIYCNDYVQGTCPASNNCNQIVKQLDSTALKYVDNAVWYTGGRNMSSKLSASSMYNAERGTTSGKICTTTPGTSCGDEVVRKVKWVGKVGLLYPTDYAYASANASCVNDLYGADSTCENQNWLHPASGEYWTISPFANTGYSVNVWGISSEKSLSHYTAPSARNIVPTLYLKYGTKLIGTGENNNNIYKIV